MKLAPSGMQYLMDSEGKHGQRIQLPFEKRSVKLRVIKIRTGERSRAISLRSTPQFQNEQCKSTNAKEKESELIIDEST